MQQKHLLLPYWYCCTCSKVVSLSCLEEDEESSPWEPDDEIDSGALSSLHLWQLLTEGVFWDFPPASECSLMSKVWSLSEERRLAIAEILHLDSASIPCPISKGQRGQINYCTQAFWMAGFPWIHTLLLRKVGHGLRRQPRKACLLQTHILY